MQLGRHVKPMLAWVTILFFAPVLASATNLLVNGDFDNSPGSLSGWTALAISGGPASIAWDGAQDCCGNSSSGSAHFPVSGPQYLRQCVTVTSGGVYDLVAYVTVTSSSISGPPPASTIQLIEFTSADCTGTSLQDVSTSSNVQQSWVRVGLPGFAVGPSGHSVLVQIESGLTGLSLIIDSHWDSIGFGPVGTLPIELREFYVE